MAKKKGPMTSASKAKATKRRGKDKLTLTNDVILETGKYDHTHKGSIHYFEPKTQPEEGPVPNRIRKVGNGCYVINWDNENATELWNKKDLEEALA